MNRRLFRYCLHLVIILTFWQPVCDADDSNFFNVIEKLHATLLNKYDKQIRPAINHNETVHVETSLHLTNFNYDELKARFSATGFFHMTWIDPRLKWSPSDYDGLESIHLPSTEVWLPDLEVYYSAPVSASIDRSFSTHFDVLILSDGTVYFIPLSNLDSGCISNSTLYPFDEVTCKIFIGSWGHSAVKINISLWNNTTTVFTDELRSPTISQWHLTKTDAFLIKNSYYESPGSYIPYHTLRFSFTLKRSLSTLKAITTPTIVIMILTFATYLIPPALSAKLHVGLINFAIICGYLLYFRTTLPSENASSPLIVSFYSGSLILVTISILSSIYFLCCVRQSKPSPHPILIRFILESRLGCLLGISQVQGNRKLETDLNQEIKATNQNCLDNNDLAIQQWTNLYLAFDRVMFIIYCLIIILFLAAFLG